MTSYRVKVAGFFFGTYRAVGDCLELHPKQAKYELLQGNIEEVDDVVEEKAKPEPTKRSSSRRVAEGNVG